MSDLSILKLGGSILTDKAGDGARVDARIRAIAQVLAPFLESEFRGRLILVHGGGAAPHRLAKTYGLADGTENTDAFSLEGVTKTLTAVAELHEYVMEVCARAGVPVTSVHPGDVMEQTSGVRRTLHTSAVTELLEAGRVPVLYGTLVPDTAWGTSIASGDAIIAALAEVLPVRTVFYASDVDGVYTSDPYTDDSAELLGEITCAELRELAKLHDSHSVDVTGGLRGKLAAIEPLLESGGVHAVHIFNGTNPQHVHNVLSGVWFPHTCIKK